jgi:hypothetical protein
VELFARDLWRSLIFPSIVSNTNLNSSKSSIEIDMSWRTERGREGEQQGGERRNRKRIQ